MYRLLYVDSFFGVAVGEPVCKAMRFFEQQMVLAWYKLQDC